MSPTPSSSIAAPTVGRRGGAGGGAAGCGTRGDRQRRSWMAVTRDAAGMSIAVTAVIAAAAGQYLAAEVVLRQKPRRP